jgi:hypothetical protein
MARTPKKPIIEQLIGQLGPVPFDERLKNLPGTPIAVDGSFLRCLPKMLWAVFRVQSNHRGVKLHLHFDILRQSPVAATLTEAMGQPGQSDRPSSGAERNGVTPRGAVPAHEIIKTRSQQ